MLPWSFTVVSELLTIMLVGVLNGLFSTLAYCGPEASRLLQDCYMSD